jgi:hypothetical protein
MRKVVAFDQTHAMFSAHSALHLDCTFHHPMNQILGDFSLLVVEKYDCCFKLVLLGPSHRETDYENFRHRRVQQL